MSATANTAPTESSTRLQSTTTLAAEWTRFELGTWLREPAAVLLNMAYPLIMLAFFFVAATNIRTDPAEALSLLGYLSLVGILMVCLNFPANGIPDARASDFYAFSRTLPLGPAPRLIAWIVTPILCGLISASFTFLIGVLVSAARPTFADFGVIMAASFGLAIPITLIGLALGFVLSRKTALAVSLTIAFAMILVGGISGFPMPDWIESVSRFLPPGAAGNITGNYLAGDPFNAWNLVVLAVWSIAGIIAAVVLYRRDEGRNFR